MTDELERDNESILYESENASEWKLSEELSECGSFDDLEHAYSKRP